MPSIDDDLLARLNALKQTPIKLSTSKSVLSTTPDVSLNIASDLAEPEPDPIIDLAARFKALGNPAKEKTKTAPRRTAQPVGAEGNDIEIEFAGGQKDDDEDKTLEELLSELGPGGGEEWMVDKEEGRGLGKLIEEARRVIPEQPSTHIGEETEISRRVGEGESSDRNESEDNEDEQDERDADEYVARVLAELEMDEKYGQEDATDLGDGDTKKESKDQTQADKDNVLSQLQLPAAPSAKPVTAPINEDTNDSLTARLNALSLLSAPSFAPSKKSVKITKSVPKFTDDEIESWCVICNDDATLKCIGCDGDLYCRNCWKEGHTGESAGYEERMHRTRKYEKKS